MGLSRTHVWMLAVFFCFAKCDFTSSDLPGPHLVIISTVSGKSTSLANVLLGADPNCHDCLLGVCSKNSIEPCSTKYAVGEWVDSTTIVSLFEDSSFHEVGGHMKVEEFIGTLENFVNSTNKFLIVLNASKHHTPGSFDTNLDPVLSQLGALYGRDFWSRVVLGATSWHFDMDSVVARNQSGRNEEWWTEMMSTTIKTRFRVSENMPAVFIDPDSKLTSNINDPIQTEAFNIETLRLFDLLETTISMEMETLQEQTDELSNIINSTLTHMQSQMDQLSNDMIEVQDDVIDNGIDISYVKGVVALNQIDIEEQDKHIQLVNENITGIHDDITEINESLNFLAYLKQTQGYECKGNITVTFPGNITSANFPANYPSMYSDSTMCSFTLIPNEGLSVNLEFVYFKTVGSLDYLEITPFGNSTLKYYGTNTPPTTTYAKDQWVYISFTMYNSMYNYDDLYKFSAMFTMV